MREISMGERSMATLPINSYLGYGPPKSGKTTFFGTAPRPLFLSDSSEHGYESLREENWNNDETPLFEPNVRPIVWTIDKETDIPEAVKKARPLVEAGLICSVWVDSITYLSDLIFNTILMAQTKRDNRQAYGELGVRLRNVRLQVASLNIIHGWLAHAKDPSEDDPNGSPMIPGQQATKFAGGVDFVWYFRQNAASAFDVYMKRFGPYVAGNRLGGRAAKLESPFRGNFAGFLDMLGYDVPAIRKTLVPIEKARADAKILAAKAAAKDEKDSKPPVVAAAATGPVIVKKTG